jgi:hypothetical protein
MGTLNIQGINETESWFFEKRNKINLPLAKWTKRRRDKTQIHKIRAEKWSITTNTTENERISREYLENTINCKI